MIVDDDVRNIFALTSLLEDRGMTVLAHDNGRDAIRHLQGEPNVDVVLMDIMMPEIDGIDTIREIRKIRRVQGSADHRRHGQGHEGRSRKVHRGGRLGLPVEARRDGADARRAPAMAASLIRRVRNGESDCGNHVAAECGGGPAVRDGASILLVDDRPDKHVVYRAILEELGQHLVSATSGEQALKQVLKTDFAVILLDVNMPGMDGLETAELIRGRKRSAHVPIIFVTADYGDEVRTAKGYSLGAVDFMVSPIVPEILRTKVKVFVDLYLLAQQARRQARERVALAAERAARAAAEKANQRSAFLARASVALSRSLNYGATTRELARLAIPFLADVAALTLSGSDGGEASTVVAWAGDGPGRSPRIRNDDGHRLRLVERGHRPASWRAGDSDRSLPPRRRHRHAARAGRARWVRSRVPRGARIESMVILPLTARSRTIGALSLGLGPTGRTFDPDLLSIASDLAGRAAIALDNVLLYRELRDQNRRKNEFLAMLSHELRNPLAPITNAVHVLKSDPGDAGKLAWASGVLERQVDQMRRLVDDLLDVSRITHGKIELRFGAHRRRRSRRRRRRDREASRRCPGTCVDGSPAVPPDARQRRLRARLPRYWRISCTTPQSTPTTEGGFRWRPERPAARRSFGVQDSGMGIPAEALATIFEVFRQLGHGSDRARGGFGVGLALVKRLVELHGGTVEARSEGRAQGQRVRRSPAPACGGDDRIRGRKPAGSTTVRAAPRRRSRRILVADDNVDLAASMGLLLEMMGNDVRVIHDGVAAVAAAAEFRPDVIFLDIGMEKMNGLDACRHIRGKPWGRDPVIVALTGWGQPEDRRGTQEAGFDHHLVKPIEPAALERFLAGIEPQTA